MRQRLWLQRLWRQRLWWLWRQRLWWLWWLVGRLRRLRLRLLFVVGRLPLLLDSSTSDTLTDAFVMAD
jgi:hypothetical protein